MDKPDFDPVFSLKVGEFMFDMNDTVLWLNVPHPENRMGLVRLPIVKGPSTDSPMAWGWDGNKEAPTLTPSISVADTWHGYLRAGKLVDA
jgi:hypothetical protein